MILVSLVWRVGLTVEEMLHFQISPAVIKFYPPTRAVSVLRNAKNFQQQCLYSRKVLFDASFTLFLPFLTDSYEGF